MCNLQLKQVEYSRYVAFLRFECHLNCAIKYSVKNQILPVLNIIFFSWKLQSNISFDLRGQFFMKFVSIKPFFFLLSFEEMLFDNKKRLNICKFGSSFIYCTPHPIFLFFYCCCWLYSAKKK